MATDGRNEAIIDASVLLNFLKIDRIDLLGRHPTYRFIVVDMVKNEVTKKGQIARLETAFLAGDLIADGPPENTSLVELATFAALSSLKLGNGDKAVIAAAAARGLALAMDDQDAWKLSAAFTAAITREDTVSIVVSLIKTGVLTVPEADAIKDDWDKKHRFKKPQFMSFAELIS
jgi:predicted nucleic acid-binding protein